MKFSTETVVALLVAFVFALLSVGAIAREQEHEASRNTYVAANVSKVAASDRDVVGLN